MLQKRILVAEDDEDDQHFLREFLKHRVDIILMPIAEDGLALVEQMDAIPDNRLLPDAIIIDQNMPKKNGLQTLQLLKNSSRYAHIPVIIYSTYADERLNRSCSEMGACLVLSKPVTREGYEEMLNMVLETCM